MSRRMVVLGPRVGDAMKAAEVTAMDAGAFLTGPWRVTTTLFGGELADATVLMHERAYDDRNPGPSERDWRAAMSICPEARQLELKLPLEVADYGRDTDRRESPMDERHAAEVERALRDLDGPISWIAENQPKLLREMPTEHAEAIKRAGKVLAGG